MFQVILPKIGALLLTVNDESSSARLDKSCRHGHQFGKYRRRVPCGTRSGAFGIISYQQGTDFPGMFATTTRRAHLQETGRQRAAPALCRSGDISSLGVFCVLCRFGLLPPAAPQPPCASPSSIPAAAAPAAALVFWPLFDCAALFIPVLCNLCAVTIFSFSYIPPLRSTPSFGFSCCAASVPRDDTLQRRAQLLPSGPRSLHSSRKVYSLCMASL